MSTNIFSICIDNLSKFKVKILNSLSSIKTTLDGFIIALSTNSQHEHNIFLFYGIFEFSLIRF